MSRTMMMNFGALFVVFVLGVAVANVGAQTGVFKPDIATPADSSKAFDNNLGTCVDGTAATASVPSTFTVTYDKAVPIFNVTISINDKFTDMDAATVQVKGEETTPVVTDCKAPNTPFTAGSGKAVFTCPSSPTSKTVIVTQLVAAAGKAFKICEIQINKNVQFMRFDWLIVSAMLLAAVRLTANK